MASTENQQKSETPTQQQPARLTIASGGYILIITAIACLVLVIWAVAPAILIASNRPPGDGKNIESYGFDLANLELDRQYLATPMLTRDMVPVIDTPTYMTAEDVEQLEGRHKYLVATDRVVGVNIGGESRAYPISLLNVHEIIHDELGGTPLAVTYSWPCDSIVVFDRRYGNDQLNFGISGMVYHSNMVFYDRQAESTTGEESLWVQLLGEAVSGPRKGQFLRRLHYQLVDWQTWLAQHPRTTVVARDPSMIKRYKDAAPVQYFASAKVLYPSLPLPPDSPYDEKTRVVAIHSPHTAQVFPLPWLQARMNENNRVPSPVELGNILFEIHPRSNTVEVQWLQKRATLYATHCFWFAWHAMYPESQLPEAQTP